MVRLMLTLTPVVCVLSAIAFSQVVELYLQDDECPKTSLTPSDSDSEESDGTDKKGNKNLYDKVNKYL